MATRRSKKEHKQVPVMDEGEVVFSVDEKLQPLIQFLYDNGFDTFNSCENNVQGTCWIEYELGDWIAIKEIAFRSDPQDLYRFIEEECHVELLSCDDGSPDDNDEWIEGEELIWTASVRFPKELLPAFEELIRTTITDFQAASEEES